MPELELVSTNDLIEELFKRSTFIGVLIYSSEQHVLDEQVHENFLVRTTTTVESSVAIVEKAVDTLKTID